jgi:tetratricopeptide (TPR) repeat protein
MAIRRRKITREKKQLEVSPADISTASDTELCDEPASAISAQLPKEPGGSTSLTTGDAASVAANATVQPADTVPDDLIQPIAQTKHASSPVSGNKRTGIQNRKLSILEIALIAGVILSTALLTYSLVSSPSSPSKSLQAHAAPPSTHAVNTHASSPVSGNQLAVSAASREGHLTAGNADMPLHSGKAGLSVNPGTRFEPRFGQPETNQPAIHTELAKEPASATGSSTESQASESSATVAEPMSLQLAESYYAEKDYVRAYNASNRLRQNLVGPEFELVRDFLQLRMGLCLSQKSKADKASEILRAVSESRSIALRAIANYHISLLEMDSGQYLKARTRAYKAIALTAALAFDCEWALAIERDCQFLAAEAITRQVLSLSDADKNLPQELWSHSTVKDPFMGLSETELFKVLNSGIEKINGGLLAPQVQAVDINPDSPALSRWSVVCNGPGIEELMARFASNAALDVKWARHTDSNSKAESKPANSGWNRSVTLYLPAATAQQVATTAAGAVGFLANVDDANTVIITDPAEYYALSEHTRMLNENAIWLWRKLLLIYGDDKRIPNAHFALGVLHDQKGQINEATAEYKLVANRYSQTPLAPFALLRSSRLKMGLQDYTGASRDLKQLIEQYPDNELIGQAHLNIAETTMKAGHYEQACSLYRKAYTLGSTTEAKTAATFGAGKCFYQLNDYESTIKWLTLYIEAIGAQQRPANKSASPESQSGADLYIAYLLLGKSHMAMGNLQQACEALGRTVKRANASEEYVEAIASLVETQIKQKDLVGALSTIQNIRAWPFSQEQATRLLLLKSNVLRELGLTDQASTLLADRVQYLTDSKLKADITLELARCQIAAEKFDTARTYLTEVLSLVEPGPVAHTASLELAEVCFKLKDYRQTISICTQLLDSSASKQIKQQASKTLAAVYSSQQDYDKAAMALLTAPAAKSKTRNNITDADDK